MTLLLAIDTSSHTAGVALLDGEQPLGEHTWRAASNHTTQLLPAIDQMATMSGRRVDEINAVGVAVGPGAFSGLRVGLVTARALAWSLGIPCFGVGSLEALAATAPTAPRVLAVIDAGRGEWYWATFGLERGVRRRLTAPQIGQPEATLGGLTRSHLLVGETSAEQRALIAARFAKRIELPEPRLPALRPAALGLLALRRLEAADTDESATLQPLYIRRPAAEERREGNA